MLQPAVIMQYTGVATHDTYATYFALMDRELTIATVLLASMSWRDITARYDTMVRR